MDRGPGSPRKKQSSSGSTSVALECHRTRNKVFPFVLEVFCLKEKIQLSLWGPRLRESPCLNICGNLTCCYLQVTAQLK